eukprot:6936706-Pyramimonas_sp.AAC.2
MTTQSRRGRGRRRQRKLDEDGEDSVDDDAERCSLNVLYIVPWPPERTAVCCVAAQTSRLRRGWRLLVGAQCDALEKHIV